MTAVRLHSGHRAPAQSECGVPQRGPGRGVLLMSSTIFEPSFLPLRHGDESNFLKGDTWQQWHQQFTASFPTGSLGGYIDHDAARIARYHSHTLEPR